MPWSFPVPGSAQVMDTSATRQSPAFRIASGRVASRPRERRGVATIFDNLQDIAVCRGSYSAFPPFSTMMLMKPCDEEGTVHEDVDHLIQGCQLRIQCFQLLPCCPFLVSYSSGLCILPRGLLCSRSSPAIFADG